jgi:predicted ATP-dependent serine protease
MKLVAFGEECLAGRVMEVPHQGRRIQKVDSSDAEHTF